MHIDLLETQALPRPDRSGTREVPGRHKAQSLHTRPGPRASKGAHLYKVRFEIQAQDIQQMPQAPAGFSPFKYQRLTIPARQKDGQAQGTAPTYRAKETVPDELLDKPPTSALGGYKGSSDQAQGTAPTEIMVPMWERVAGGQEVNGAVWGVLNEPTIHLRTPALGRDKSGVHDKSAPDWEKKQGDLLDIPRFIGYTVGAVAVLGLYLIIPLIILLNAILPSTWNRLFVALGILAVGEILICTVLAKTIPRGPSQTKAREHQQHAKDNLNDLEALWHAHAAMQRRHVVQENRGDVLVQL